MSTKNEANWLVGMLGKELSLVQIQNIQKIQKT